MSGHDAIKLVEDLAKSEKKSGRSDRASVLETAVSLLKRTAENEITKEIVAPLCISCRSAMSNKSAPDNHLP